MTSLPLATPSTPPGLRGPAPGPGFDLREQLLSLWRARVPILVLAIVLAGAGAILSLLGTRQYEATATLSVTPSKAGDPAGPNPALALSFVPLIGSHTVAQQVVNELNLDDAPYRLTPSRLLDEVVTVRAVPDSTLVRVVARIDNPELAARVAARFAELGIEHARHVTEGEVDSVTKELADMVEQANARATEAEKAYDDYRRTAQLELIKKEVETLLDQRADLMKVTVELEAERARLAKAEQEREARSPTTTLRQSIVEDTAMTEAARSQSDSTRALLGMQMNREVSNPVFEEIDAEVADARAKVASLERARERLLQATGLKGEELTRLSQLYEREATLERLDLERKLARKTYEDVAAKYQGLRLAAIARTPQLHIVDPALVPHSPTGRYLLRNVMLGAVAGLFLGCVYVLAREALTRPRA